MKYLVTGGAGFIGSHLVDRLLEDGNSVIVLDNFSTGNLENLTQHKHNKLLEVITGNILDRNLVDNLVKRCDRVFHFAAAVGVFNIMERPLESLEINVNGTHNVLKVCQDLSKPVLLASSSEIYGKNDSDLLSEDSDRIIGAPQKIRWSYSDSKALDESMAISMHQQFGVETRIVRLFNTVGPRQVGRYGMVVPRFVNAALRNDPIVIYGTGNQTRCFGHILDIVEGIIRIDQCSAATGKPVNIGVDQEISIIDLARMVIEVTSSRSRIEFMPYELAYPSGYEDMSRRVPDNRLLRELTGWKSQRALQDIIQDLVSSFNF